MNFSIFLFIAAFVQGAFAAEPTGDDTPQLRGNVAARELSTTEFRTGKQIKRRFNTFECLAIPGKGATGRFEDCKDRKDDVYQYFEFDKSFLVSSYLKWKDRELWCVTFVPDRNEITLRKCEFGNNTQRWSFSSGEFKSFYESQTCLTGPDDARVEDCEFGNDDQEFHFI